MICVGKTLGRTGSMRNKMALAALSFALVLGGASATMAKSKGGGLQVDPREAYLLKNGTKRTYCDIDPSCNGWTEWLRGKQAGKKYRPVTLPSLSKSS